MCSGSIIYWVVIVMAQVVHKVSSKSVCCKVRDVEIWPLFVLSFILIQNTAICFEWDM